MHYAIAVVFFWNIFLLSNAQTQNNDDLLAVVQVFRHGQNTPYYFYPNDPHKDNTTLKRRGVLTSVGKQQEYELGKYTKERYKDWLPTIFSWAHFMGHTTDTERTKTSCQSVMAGIFSSDSETWSESVPIYKYYYHLPDEEIFSSSPDCKIYDTELSHVLLHGELFDGLEEEYAEKIKIISESSGIHIKSIFGVYSIYETLVIEEQLGLTLPDWTSSVYPDTMQTLSGYALKALSYTEEAKRLAAGSWLFNTLSYFQQIVDGHTWLAKYHLYSGHDTNLAAILNTIEAFEPHVPAFADSIYFELRNKSGEAVVNVWHKTESGCEQIAIACCDLDCPLDTVTELLKKRMVDKRMWKYDCSAQATKHTFIPREERRIDIRRKREEAMLVLNRKRPEYKPFTWLR